MATDTTFNPATASSGWLWSEYERLSAESAQLLDAGDMAGYREVERQESAVTAEIDKRSAVGTSLDQPKAKAVPARAGEVISARRRDLAAARAEAARLGDVKPRQPGAAPPPGKTVDEVDAEYRASVEAKLEVGAIAEEIRTLEQRAPFFDFTDEQVNDKLEDIRIEVERYKSDATRYAQDGRPRAAAKAQRLAEEAEASSMDLYREDAQRKADRDHAKLIEVMSYEKALKARADALAMWTKELREREDMSARYAAGEEGIPSKYANLGIVVEARKNVEAIQQMAAQSAKPSEAEIKLQRDIIQAEAPRRRGSWAS
jgi:hypothetical protein